MLAQGTNKELKVRAGDEIHFMLKLLHHDESQWGTNHNEYIPERFDPTSEHFKAPNGKTRHPYAYAPFFGGHRMCLGKTFAETAAKKQIAMILKFYKLEHADPKNKIESTDYEFFQLAPPDFKFKF